MRKHHVPIRTSKYCLSVAVLVMWLAAGVELRADQTVVVRSGNGTIGSQDSLIHVLPFRTTGDITPTPANFSDAQSSPQAYVVTPYGAYIPSLPSDPNAKWIAVNTNLPAGSALFAMPFQVTDSTITAASLAFHFAVDNGANGVFINVTRIMRNSLDGDYHAEFRFVRNDIAPLLIPNATNWIYVNMSDYGVIAALIFNATITTQGTSKDVQPNVGGNTGFVSVQIFGQGFPSGDVSATLSGNGQPDITAISATTIDKNEVDATFDLRGIVPGTRDVSITQGGVSV